MTIGRSPENEVQLNDMQVSRKHAVVQQTALGTVIRDLGSGNGTYIGDRRILEYRLAHGDVIRIGPLEMLFESTVKAPDAAPSTRSVVFDHHEPGSVQAQSACDLRQTFFRAPDKAASVERLRQVQERLAAVYAANQIIASERDLGRLFERVMDQLFTLVPAHNGAILLANTETGELESHFARSGEGRPEVTPSFTIVRRAFEQGEAILTRDAADDARLNRGESIIRHNISSAMCAPLQHQNDTLGVLYVDTRGTRNAFGESDLELLVALAGPAAIAIRNAQYLGQLERAFEDTLVMTSNAIEMRDHYTVGHTWRVTNFSVAIGRELGWSEEKLKECEMGGVLHDVGKIAIDDAILRKPQRLTEDEYAKMKVHPERGARMMQDVARLIPLIPYALYHHERYDGKGYPFGMTGESIPLEGRVVAVADTFDAMTSNRPYRKGLDPEIAVAELEKGKGTQFDPVVVDALVACYRSGKLDAILQESQKGERSVVCPFCSTYIPIPEGVHVGDIFQCGVCHRRNRLMERNDALFAEWVPAAHPVSTPLPDDDAGKTS